MSTLPFKSIQMAYSLKSPNVFKFYMWHDQTTGLQNEETQSGRESKLAASAKNSNNEISCFSKMAGYV